MLAPNEKLRFAASVRIYIQHKRVLEQYSAWYKRGDVAHSMSKCYSLFQTVKRDCSAYSVQQLARMVIINEQDLFNILPNPNNPTYAKQSEKLTEIINKAKNYLR